MKLFKLFVLLSLFTSTLAAQVIIREKVEVKPKAPAKIKTTSSSASELIFTFELNGTTDPVRPTFISVDNLSCNTTNSTNLTTLTIPAVAGGYHVLAGFSSLSAVNYTFTIRLGTKLLVQETGNVAANTTVRLDKGIPLFNAVMMQVVGSNATMFYGESKEFSASRDANPPCSGPAFSADEMVTLNITEGASFGNLYDQGVLQGSTYTASFGDLASVEYKADGEVPFMDEVPVTIEASAGGASIGTLHLTIKKPQPVLDHFEIVTTSDTVAHSKSIGLTVTAKDINDQEIPLDGSRQLVLYVSPGGGDVKIEKNGMSLFTRTLRPQRPTLEALAIKKGERVAASTFGSFVIEGQAPSPDEITVTYATAHSGAISYLADGGVPTGNNPEPVVINVAATDDFTKYGLKVVTVTPASVLNHFTVKVTPDTVSFGETSVITIQGKDANDFNVDPPAGAKVNVVLRTDEQYGNLSYSGIVGKTLTDVPYEDARDGKVLFAATGKNPLGLDPQSVPIGVTMAGTLNIAGSTAVVVKPTIEKFCQGDGRWGGQNYDSFKQLDDKGNVKQPERQFTIGEKGCALSCMAMVLNAVGLNYNWRAINDYGSSKLSSEPKRVGSDLNWKNKTPLDLTGIDNYLTKKDFVIVLVGNSSSGDPTKLWNHWVLLTGKTGGKYQIIDPGRCDNNSRTTLDSYTNKIYRAIIYERKQQ
ncbi:MAG: hypothetical protein HY088_08455 [Ignavibacteriales bacterium]|nr:hypothetical protein [Ignavibacteriales bacterium]